MPFWLWNEHYAGNSDAINNFDHGERQVYGTRATAQIFASYPGPHLNAFNGILDQVCSV